MAVAKKVTDFLVELKNSDPTNSLIEQKTEVFEKLKIEVLQIKSKLYELKLDQEKIEQTLINKTSIKNVDYINSLSREIESKYQVHLLNNLAKKKFKNSKILENESYVEKMVMRLVINQFKKEQKIDINTTDVRRINSIIVKEYMNEYNGNVA